MSDITRQIEQMEKMSAASRVVTDLNDRMTALLLLCVVGVHLLSLKEYPMLDPPKKHEHASKVRNAFSELLISEARMKDVQAIYDQHESMLYTITGVITLVHDIMAGK